MDDDERTTSMGLFNTAEAFRLSAIALEAAKVDIGHAIKPILFCYYHALELFLKALLRQKHSVETISSKKFGHNIERLVKEAEMLGLVIVDEDRDVFSAVDTEAMLEARYIRTGSKNLPQLEDLRRSCKRVRDDVGRLLSKAGVPVRL
jgi:HEPN domain-containing protein